MTTETTPKRILTKAGQTKLFDKLQADNWLKGTEQEEIKSKMQLQHIIRTMCEKIVRLWENLSSILKHKEKYNHWWNSDLSVQGKELEL